MQYPKTAKVLEFERTHPSKRKQNGLLDGDFTPAERREAQHGLGRRGFRELAPKGTRTPSYSTPESFGWVVC